MLKWLLTAVILFPLAALAGFVEEPQFGENSTESMNWCDFDLDGDLDIAQANSNGDDNYFYVNQGDGTFTFWTDGGEYMLTYSAAWGDCDNDFDPDLATGCSNFPPTNFIYVNDGSGNFEKTLELGMTTTYALVWADFDLDGDLDVALTDFDPDEQLYLYSNNGDGTFEEAAVFSVGTEWLWPLAWGDADGDGDPDLAIGSSDWREKPQNYLYVNNGDGTFTSQPQFGEGATCSLSWGDFDNDGDLDMAVGNNAKPDHGVEGQNYLYVNEGDLNFTAREEFGTLNSSLSVAWADYDNDGDLDLAVGNTGEKNELYMNNGDGTFTATEPFGSGEDRSWSICWGDYDLDGDLDLAEGVQFYQSYLYVNDENDEDYLSIYPVGRYGTAGPGYSNGSGIGAKVYAYEPGYLGSKSGLLAFREVGSGRSGGDDSINVEFGLPRNETVEVRIIWPGSDGSKITQDLIADKTQFITVHESIFHLLSPEDGEDAGGFPLVLDWEKTFSGGNDPYDANVENYTLEIASDGDFANVIYTVGLTDNKVVLDEGCGLSIGETYYWRVFANYVDTPGHYSQYSSEAWSFNLVDIETGIVLDYFEAASENDGIEMSWAVNETEETGVAGFNLYRSVASDEVDAKAITSRDILNAELVTGESPYEYVDTGVERDVTYRYWLEVIDVGGSSETFGPVECTWNGALPTTYALYQSRPNPAKGTATIAFDLPEVADVTLTVYDISGRKVTTLVNETLAAGEHAAEVSVLAPGVYVYKLDAGNYSAAKKMVVVN
ncbi:MAG: T9SS type A sorting domain-containing protein [Candidatus Coatesbacteria bacterium]|nr:MAG: T9SS type A sorting domain-containing protein [Candidatus Coatesbacteria bacterium]